MTQIRAFDYGSDYSHAKHVSLNTGTHNYGVYTGFDITVTGNNTVSIGPGSAMFYPGVHIEEDGNTEISLVAPELPTVFTLAYKFLYDKIIGGKQAEIVSYEGYFATVLNGIVIGWIDHPGGGVAFNQHQVILSERFRLDHVIDDMVQKDLVLLPPFNSTPIPPHPLLTFYGTDYEGGRLHLNIEYAGVISQKVSRGVGVDIREDIRMVCPVYLSSSRRPLFFDVKTKASYGAEVRYRIYDTAQKSVAVFSITGEGTDIGLWQETSFDIPFVEGVTWEKNKIFTIQIDYRLKPKEAGHTAMMRFRFFK